MTKLSWHVVATQELPSWAQELGGHGLGGSRRVSYAPLGWAAAGSSGWAVFVLGYTSDGPARVDASTGTCSSVEDGMDQASVALLAAMNKRYEAILDWQHETEKAGAPSGGDVTFCSPVAKSVVSISLCWSTHSISQDRVREGLMRQSWMSHSWTNQDAHGIASSNERAQRMARDSLADVTAYRADILREWLEKHKPAAPADPVTYLDVLRHAVTHLGDPVEVAKPKVEVSFEGGTMRIALTIPGYELPEHFSVENKRVFEGPLFCHTCGLPAVPFGGEDICLDPTHDHEEREREERDRDDEDDAQ